MNEKVRINREGITAQEQELLSSAIGIITTIALLDSISKLSKGLMRLGDKND